MMQELIKTLAGKGVHDHVLEVMAQVPRHEFVPSELAHLAYQDRPLPIGEGQTISQPSIVASMTQLLDLTGSERVLEIGTGSAYQTAILAGMAKEVYTVEIDPVLAQQARGRLATYPNVSVCQADGYWGWALAAPFDAILVTAATPSIPPPLLDQLGPGGRLVIPLGERGKIQTLWRVNRTQKGFHWQESLEVRFVPLVRG